jgi:hypothetical protein
VRPVFGFPDTVNDVSARGVAAGTAVEGVLCLALHWHWLIPVLAVQFLLRVSTGPRFEPLALLVTRVVTPALPVEPRPTPGPPKRFAQGIGAGVTVAAAVLAFGVGATWAAEALIGLLVVFACLEAALGLCVGCRLFALLMRVGVIPETVCEECADLSRRLRADVATAPASPLDAR